LFIYLEIIIFYKFFLFYYIIRMTIRMRGGGIDLTDPLNTFTAAHTAYVTDLARLPDEADKDEADKSEIEKNKSEIESTFADAIEAFILTLQTELPKLPRKSLGGGRRHRRSKRSRRPRKSRRSRRSRRRH